MKIIWPYLADYKRYLNKRLLVVCMCFIAVLIFLNYNYGLETWLTSLPALPGAGVTGRILLFSLSFGLPYLLSSWLNGQSYWKNPKFLMLFFTAVILFSLKSGFGPPASWFLPGDKNDYWDYILYWPARLLLILGVLFIFYKRTDPSFFGLTWRSIPLSPYVYMLVLMIPLVAFASTQPDFLAMYPKLKVVLPFLNGAEYVGWKKLLFELAYGSDFIGIEVFFRGFLIFSFARFAGRDAILPMACFYCTIHFGKPLFECISSFGGGLLLGIVSYHSRSVIGGLIVHLGIAWMMELGGFLGNLLK